MKKTLVIMAAGIGSRFGGGIKQLTPVGPNGEVIIDYSIHDAIKYGFNKIIFIIRKDIEKDFREIIGDRTEKICKEKNVEVAYVFQTMDNIPDELKKDRVKPWGTGHALLCCKDVIDGPFAVINADDFYGSDGFLKASQQIEIGRYGLIGYELDNTLSDNGGVSRGLCTVKNGLLTDIKETSNIVKTETGAESAGVAIDPKTTVSMNLWCLPCSFTKVLEDNFADFIKNISNPVKDEYMLPSVVDSQIKLGAEVDVITTSARWFGVTYKEDKDSVIESFKYLYKKGEYNLNLYSDII